MLTHGLTLCEVEVMIAEPAARRCGLGSTLATLQYSIRCLREVSCVGYAMVWVSPPEFTSIHCQDRDEQCRELAVI